MTTKEVLIKDYEITQAFIDKIDRYLFWVRNWTIVLCSAVIVFSVTNNNPFILFSNAFIVLVFLFMELVQKSFHEDAMKHSYDIEELIQKSLSGKAVLPKDYDFGLGHAIQKVKGKKLLTILCHPARWHNVAFYLIVLISSLVTYLMIPLINVN